MNSMHGQDPRAPITVPGDASNHNVGTSGAGVANTSLFTLVPPTAPSAVITRSDRFRRTLTNPFQALVSRRQAHPKSRPLIDRSGHPLHSTSPGLAAASGEVGDRSSRSTASRASRRSLFTVDGLPEPSVNDDPTTSIYLPETDARSCHAAIQPRMSHLAHAANAAGPNLLDPGTPADNLAPAGPLPPSHPSSSSHQRPRHEHPTQQHQQQLHEHIWWDQPGRNSGEQQRPPAQQHQLVWRVATGVAGSSGSSNSTAAQSAAGPLPSAAPVEAVAAVTPSPLDGTGPSGVWGVMYDLLGMTVGTAAATAASSSTQVPSGEPLLLQMAPSAGVRTGSPPGQRVGLPPSLQGSSASGPGSGPGAGRHPPLPPLSGCMSRTAVWEEGTSSTAGTGGAAAVTERGQGEDAAVLPLWAAAPAVPGAATTAVPMGFAAVAAVGLLPNPAGCPAAAGPLAGPNAAAGSSSPVRTAAVTPGGRGGGLTEWDDARNPMSLYYDPSLDVAQPPQPPQPPQPSQPSQPSDAAASVHSAPTTTHSARPPLPPAASAPSGSYLPPACGLATAGSPFSSPHVQYVYYNPQDKYPHPHTVPYPLPPEHGTAGGATGAAAGDDHFVVLEMKETRDTPSTAAAAAAAVASGASASAAAPDAAAAQLGMTLSLRGRMVSYFSKWRGVGDTLMPADKPVDVFWSWLGAFLSIMVVALLQQYLTPHVSLPLMIASFGASAVLLFGVPASKLAQPRNFLGGQVVSAVVGVAVRLMFVDAPSLVWLSASLGMSLALAAMQFTRTTHPPGGASALIAASAVNIGPWHGFKFVLTVFFGCIAMLAVALVVNNLSSRRRYPTYWMGK